MSEATLSRVFECVFASPFLANEITILWHAGEPLVLGAPYYQQAFAIIRQLKPAELVVKHSFQTNGTLINREWIDFFKSENVRVGVSVDGPAVLHDRYRKTRRNTGSFEQVMRGVRLLQDHSFPFHVITVLTRESLNRYRELFDFYIGSHIKEVGFNVEEIEGDHKASSLQDRGIDREIRRFFSEFLKLMDQSKAPLHVREFMGALSGIADGNNVHYGNPLAEALRMVSIGVHGEISTFSPELLGYGSERHGTYVFGNVHTNEIADVLINPRFLAVNNEIERGLDRCRASCDYFEICRGGAPANKLFENGTFDSCETLFCRLTKKVVIDVVLDRMERALELAT